MLLLKKKLLSNALFNNVPLNLLQNFTFVRTFVTKFPKSAGYSPGITSLIKCMSTRSKYYLIDKTKHILYTALCKGI